MQVRNANAQTGKNAFSARWRMTERRTKANGTADHPQGFGLCRHLGLTWSQSVKMGSNPSWRWRSSSRGHIRPREIGRTATSSAQRQT